MSTPITSLLDRLQSLPDPRINRRKLHPLPEVLLIGLSCMLCGGENFTDMEDFARAKKDWLKTFLKLPGGIPSHDTFNRVFMLVKSEHFLDLLVQWTQSVRQTLGAEIVSIDGKALRRAKRQGQPVPYMVNAWAKDNGLVLGQYRVNDKSNEIKAIPHLLRQLELAQSTGTAVNGDGQTIYHLSAIFKVSRI
ncbi:MAG: ISAs1 family transposase [Verrucomicrobiota bacterium]|nr:ISAs1 family transposase [Verrucomicrobiota bacterium]